MNYFLFLKTSITLATAGETMRFIKNSETKFQPASTRKMNLNEGVIAGIPRDVWIAAISLKKNKSIAFVLNTGDEELIEGNNWGDRFWGQCDGEGINKLGQLLMKVREELRNE